MPFLAETFCLLSSPNASTKYFSQYFKDQNSLVFYSCMHMGHFPQDGENEQNVASLTLLCDQAELQHFKERSIFATSRFQQILTFL